MQQRRTSAFVMAACVLCITCAGFVWAKSSAIVGMVTETRGHAYWQKDSKKIRMQELAELPENAKLVLAKGSRLVVVYLVSGQQYELNGPALVQFKNSKPVALSGMIPKTIGATPVLTDKKRIDPKSVQTAGQTLVSTETKADPDFPVAVTAPPPPPPPPPAPARMMAPSPVPDTIAAAEARKRIEASEAAAKRSVEAEMMAARQAETAARQARTAESASLVAEREAAKAAAAKAADRNAEKKAAEPTQEPECLPQAIDADSVQPQVDSCDEIKN